MPQVNGHFNNYLRRKIKDTFFLSPITENEIARELTKLNQNKSCGPDELKPKLVKACKTQFLKPLNILFDKSIECGEYPSEFKLAKVIYSLYKKNVTKYTK